jgi:hypothetical protein
VAARRVATAAPLCAARQRWPVFPERHRSLETERARDDYPEPAPERISHDPRFVWPGGVPAASDDRRFDALAAVSRDAFDVEDGSGPDSGARSTLYSVRPLKGGAYWRSRNQSRVGKNIKNVEGSGTDSTEAPGSGLPKPSTTAADINWALSWANPPSSAAETVASAP